MEHFDIAIIGTGASAVQVIPDEKSVSADLRVIAGQAGKVFDGVLVRKTTVLPPGMRVLMTEYVFAVNEWFKDPQAARTVTVMELGGQDEDGSAVSTVSSHKLTLGGRYLVFMTPNDGQMLLPMTRVFQVLDTGTKVADESGRVVVGLNGAVPVLRATPELPSTNYLGTPLPPNTRLDYGPPTVDFATPRPRVLTQAVPDHGPIAAEQMFRLLRAEGARPPAGRQGTGTMRRESWCGWKRARGTSCWNWTGSMRRSRWRTF